jgi:hypothetical protein
MQNKCKVGAIRGRDIDSSQFQVAWSTTAFSMFNLQSYKCCENVIETVSSTTTVILSQHRPHHYVPTLQMFRCLQNHPLVSSASPFPAHSFSNPLFRADADPKSQKVTLAMVAALADELRAERMKILADQQQPANTAYAHHNAVHFMEASMQNCYGLKELHQVCCDD